MLSVDKSDSWVIIYHMEKILAIDIGNSKTEYVIGDNNGLILGRYIGLGANYQVLGYEEALTLLTNSIEKLLSETGFKMDSISYVYIGAAGADSKTDYDNLQKLFKTIFKNVSFSFENDGIISLKNGVVDRAGMVITCGTGNVNYAIDSMGKTLRLGGYCPELGDVLGTETIVKTVISRASRSYDSREFSSILPQLIMDKLGLDNFFEIEELDYFSELAPSIISLFLKACELGDGLSLNICWTLTKEVLTIIEYFHSNLLKSVIGSRLALDGHIFRTDNALTKMIKLAVSARYDIEIVVPDTPPVFGAYYFCLEKLGVTIDRDVLTNMKESYVNMEVLI